MQSGKLWGQRVENMRASFEHFKAVAASEPVLKRSDMAAAKTKAAAVAAAAAAAAAAPGVGDFVAGPEFTAALKMACFLPALLGLWKAESLGTHWFYLRATAAAADLTCSSLQLVACYLSLVAGSWQLAPIS